MIVVVGCYEVTDGQPSMDALHKLALVMQVLAFVRLLELASRSGVVVRGDAAFGTCNTDSVASEYGLDLDSGGLVDAGAGVGVSLNVRTYVRGG